MTTLLKKAALFSDIHFGRKNNSEEHNTDCTNFVEWFCEKVKADPEIDHIWFLGDWHEHRAAVHAFTLQKSYYAAKMLNDLGLPVYFIVRKSRYGRSKQANHVHHRTLRFSREL